MVLFGSVGLLVLYKYVEPDLPDVGKLKDIRLQKPLLVYSADGHLIAQYGEKRRIPLTIDQIPPKMVEAFIAIEDRRFYEHHGFDPKGIMRAVYVMIKKGGATQGGSTITQQLAKNIFLSPKRDIKRKIRELFLAIHIERQFSKEEILELYLNKIFLGQRAYGIGAAAYVYFGKNVNELTLGEMATIAGLPSSPSVTNPINSKKNAIARRNIVLKKMLEEKFITEDEYSKAINEPMVAHYHEPEIEFSAPYLTEMVRQAMIKQFGDEATTSGYKVYTTITRNLQLTATEALQNNILNYDMRHGYRGVVDTLWQADSPSWDKEQIIAKLKKIPQYGPLKIAVVTEADAQKATAMLNNGDLVTLQLQSVKWANPKAKGVNEIIHAGQVIWLRLNNNQLLLSQMPEVNSGFVALNPNDGAILALVGGFDFYASQFNRVTQSIRQVGSTIKPFIYASALDKGMTPATILNDLPITHWDERGYAKWRPKNATPKYSGPLRLRVGLGQSKNVMTVRAMRAIGVDYVADYLERFGLMPRSIERTESLALGAATLTPLQLARGYAVFANGGYLIDPYFISRIESDSGEIIFKAQPKIVCRECNLPVIYGETEKSSVLMNKNLEDVIYSTKNAATVIDEGLEAGEESTALPEIMELPHLEVLGNTSDNQDNSIESTDNPLKGTNPSENNSNLSSSTDIHKENYAPKVISSQLAFLMNDLLKSNISGEPGGGWLPTGWRAARELKRPDIGGKTGTTNNTKDAWFTGYGPDVIATVWVGFDDHKYSLGRGEEGSKTALPAWINFMKVALADTPVQKAIVPEGIVSYSIDMKTGNLKPSGGPGTRKEYFIKGTEPTRESSNDNGAVIVSQDGKVEELF